MTATFSSRLSATSTPLKHAWEHTVGSRSCAARTPRRCTLARVIHAYPTQGEAIKKAADAYNRTRLTPFRKSLMRKWLGWTAPAWAVKAVNGRTVRT